MGLNQRRRIFHISQYEVSGIEQRVCSSLEEMRVHALHFVQTCVCVCSNMCLYVLYTRHEASERDRRERVCECVLYVMLHKC